METKIVEVVRAHQAENIFDITPGTTVMQEIEVVPDEVVESGEYDEKDQEIDNQFQQVFNAAIQVFETQRNSTESMPPQFKARTLEVAAQFLNTALAAAKEKSNMKQNKDKVQKPSSVVNHNNNTVVMDRNSMLRLLKEQAAEAAAMEANTIDEQPKDVN